MMLAAPSYLARGAWVCVKKPSCIQVEFGRMYSAHLQLDSNVITDTTRNRNQSMHRDLCFAYLCM
jgi:hypothetical protein